MNVEVIKPNNNDNELVGCTKSVKLNLKKYKKEFKSFPKESLDSGLKKIIEWGKFIYE